ncbi:unnamed protein product, partial [Brachionus calyciflorus]
LYNEYDVALNIPIEKTQDEPVEEYTDETSLSSTTNEE